MYSKLIDTFKQTADQIAFLDRGYGIGKPDVQSAVEKLYSMIIRTTPTLEIVSVKDFGAKGDGVTDDTQAIQNAFDSGAKYIHIPDGTYLINQGLKINNEIFISGAQNTIIKAGQEIDTMLSLGETKPSFFLVSKIILDADGKAQDCIIIDSGERDFFGRQMNTYYYDNLRLKNATRYGLWCRTDINYVRNLFTTNMGSHSLSTTDAILYVDGFYAYENKALAVDISRGRAFIENFVIDGGGGAKSSMGCERNVWKNGIFRNINDSEIYEHTGDAPDNITIFENVDFIDCKSRLRFNNGVVYLKNVTMNTFSHPDGAIYATCKALYVDGLEITGSETVANSGKALNLNLPFAHIENFLIQNTTSEDVTVRCLGEGGTYIFKNGVFKNNKGRLLEQDNSNFVILDGIVYDIADLTSEDLNSIAIRCYNGGYIKITNSNFKRFDSAKQTLYNFNGADRWIVRDNWGIDSVDNVDNIPTDE